MIKTEIVIMLLMASIGICNAQTSVIEQLENDEFKFNAPNYFRISVNGIDCNELYLKSEEEIVSREECNWYISPKKFYQNPGLGIEVYKITGNDTFHIETRYFDVRRMEPLIAEVGFSNDTISIDDFRHVKGMRTFARKGKYGCVNGKLKQFKVLILREEQAFHYITNKGAKFSSELIEMISELKPNDVIHFFDIEQTKEFQSIYRKTGDFKLIIK